MNDPLSYTGITQIATTILAKTQAGQAAWQTDGEWFTLRTPPAMISIRAAAEDDDAEYLVAVSLPDGREIGRIAVASSDGNYAMYQSLYEGAAKACWSALADAIQKSVHESATIGVTTSTGPTTTTTPAPELPPRPTSKQALDVFERIAGEWHLDFSKGQEDVRISEDGNLFVLTTSRGKVVATTMRPTFRLELLACNSSLDQVEIAKVEPNGRTRQIEVLHITETEMSGSAKHDGHSLKYTRR